MTQTACKVLNSRHCDPQTMAARDTRFRTTDTGKLSGIYRLFIHPKNKGQHLNDRKLFSKTKQASLQHVAVWVPCPRLCARERRALPLAQNCSMRSQAFLPPCTFQNRVHKYHAPGCLQQLGIQILAFGQLSAGCVFKAIYKDLPLGHILALALEPNEHSVRSLAARSRLIQWLEETSGSGFCYRK